MTWSCHRWISCLCLATTLAVAGCSKDLKEIADQHVRSDMLDKHQKRPAIEFLQKNGKFFDVEGTTHVDQEIVLPLLKRLNEIVPTPQWALMRPDKPEWAYAMAVGLPKDIKVVDRMADAVQEADDKFPGMIAQQWGHEWLLFNLIDQQSYETLKKSNPRIDDQR
jgi:hypothetical protein